MKDFITREQRLNKTPYKEANHSLYVGFALLIVVILGFIVSTNELKEIKDMQQASNCFQFNSTEQSINDFINNE